MNAQQQSLIDLSIVPNNVPSLCIPRVYANISEKRIREIFSELFLGEIARVDMVHKTSDKGEKYNRVFIHFVTWYSSENADYARKRLLGGNEIKVVYSDPWFWKISAYREPKQTRPTAPRILSEVQSRIAPTLIIEAPVIAPTLSHNAPTFRPQQVSRTRVVDNRSQDVRAIREHEEREQARQDRAIREKQEREQARREEEDRQREERELALKEENELRECTVESDESLTIEYNISPIPPLDKKSQALNKRLKEAVWNK